MWMTLAYRMMLYSRLTSVANWLTEELVLNIGLLEDDQPQSEMLCDWLREEGFTVSVAATVAQFIQLVKSQLFDLLILDWELPDTSGYEVLKQLRGVMTVATPILFTTQRDEEHDIVSALEAGADDYLIKPLRKAEILARLKAVLRRSNTEPPDLSLVLGPIELDLGTHTAKVNGEEVKLTNKDFDLAAFMFNNLGKILSREYLLKMVWGIGQDINTRTVDMHISRIRRKLNINQSIGYSLKTVYQHGYRLEKI